MLDKERGGISTGDIERAFLFEMATKGQDTAKTWLKKTTDQAKGIEEAENMLKYFEAGMLANDSRVATGALVSSIKKEIMVEGRQLIDLSANEFLQKLHSGTVTQEIVKMEKHALELCKEASKTWWKGKYIDASGVLFLGNELEYRITNFLPEGEEKIKTLENLNKNLLTLAKQNLQGGLRAEYILEWAVRTIALQKGKNHLVQVEHGPPGIDQAKKIDIILYIGDKVYNLQQKTLSDLNSPDAQEILDKTTKELKGTNITLLPLEADEVNRLDVPAIKRSLLRHLPEEAKDYFNDSKKRGSEKSETRTLKDVKKSVEALFRGKSFPKFQFLSEYNFSGAIKIDLGDKTNVGKAALAFKTFEEHVKSIKNKEDAENLEKKMQAYSTPAVSG